MLTAPLVFAGAALAGPVLKCDSVPAASFGSEVKIESATLVTATSLLPDHCDIRGTIWPEARFAVKLPTDWNHRFEMMGNGGTAGAISFAAMDRGVGKGYASASTDTGHDAAKEPLASFAYPGPNNPNAKRKATDFGYQAVHETALLAKKIISAYYGEAPRFSYWVGCSTGGRQGLMEAQRFPEDFNGLVIGAPVLSGTGNNMRLIWNAQAQVGPGLIADEKLPALANAVYEKCDRVDGLADGLIDDPRNCVFDPARDLPKCPADADNANCFTGAQVEALRKIYGGAKTSAGKKISPGLPVGAEVVAPSAQSGPKSGWAGVVAGTSNSSLARAESYMKFLVLDPAPGLSWNFRMYDFDTDPQKMAAAAAFMDATNPDLRPLKQRGGKILQYHGWADPLINAMLSVDYYEAALQRMVARRPRNSTGYSWFQECFTAAAVWAVERWIG